MEMLNELANLVQQAESIKDDSDLGVVSVNIGTCGSYIHISHNLFLSNFNSFDMELIEDNVDPYYEITTEIEGVRFMALIDFSEIAELEQSLPGQFDYISKMIQEEPA